MTEETKTKPSLMVEGPALDFVVYCAGMYMQDDLALPRKLMKGAEDLVGALNALADKQKKEKANAGKRGE